MLEVDSTTTLASLFSAHRDRAWYFVAPGGNWGDSLIYAGAESLASSLGMRWTDLDHRTIDSMPPPRGACIYLHGGGGLNPWSSGRAFANLKRAVRVPDALVIQGPQTCDIDNPATRDLTAGALSELAASRIHFFAREWTTARLLAGILPPALRLHVDHDTAFHLRHDELLALAGLRTTPRGRYRLVIAREDDEAPGVPVATGREAVRMDPAFFASTFPHWVRIHAHATHIISNRLHSAIAGTLLGKPVGLLPGVYHKNRSVWEFSLKERGVEWRERLDAGPASQRPRGWLPRRIGNSWKVRRSLLWLRGVPLH